MKMKEGKPNPKERDSGYRYKEGKNIRYFKI